jgi:micrococcal nuclease
MSTRPYKIEELEAVTMSTVKDIEYDFTEAKVIKVYDGDTFTIAAYYDNAFRKFSVRLYGVDCPEMRGPHKDRAILARDFVTDLILNKVVTINVYNNKKINGKKMVEKFGRLLADIWVGEKLLSQLLYENGHAVKYYGGKKEEE